jgi:prepilin-type N-terminal cleavage/methylation domain-containing protein
MMDQAVLGATPAPPAFRAEPRGANVSMHRHHVAERTKVLKDPKQRRQDEWGFTLIELMVVVLIMGILMAIAIPTFLSTRGSADDAAAKSNATNAFTNQKSYYTTSLLFIDTPVNSNGAVLDSSLPWDVAAKATYAGGETTAGDVSALALSALSAEASASPYQGPILVVESLSKANNCFYIVDNESVIGKSFIGYAETSGGCSAAANITMLAAAPAAGAASAVTVPAFGTGIATWYRSW